jgi:hypothetical protein
MVQEQGKAYEEYKNPSKEYHLYIEVPGKNLHRFVKNIGGLHAVAKSIGMWRS